MPSLNRLPQELLDQILNYLEEDLPGIGDDPYLYEQPFLEAEPEELHGEKADSNLKTLSLVSSRLRNVVLARLFRRVQLRVCPPAIRAREHADRDELFTWVSQISDIAEFLRKKSLTSTVRSFLLMIVDGKGHYNIDYYEELQRDLTEEYASIGHHWHRLLAETPLLERLTIIAPPYCLGVMISIPLNPYISEILHMPYHVLSLSRKSRSPITSTNVTEMLSSLHIGSKSVLSAVQWTSMLLNEGSFIRYYAQAPGDWQDELLSASNKQGDSKLPAGLLTSLTSFDYIGIVPPSETVIGLIRNLQTMPLLQRFSIQTQPINDLLRDSAQRSIASHNHLVIAIRVGFELVYNEMIARRGMRDNPTKQFGFQQLEYIRCRDTSSLAVQLWETATNKAELRKWRRDQNGGLAYCLDVLESSVAQTKLAR